VRAGGRARRVGHTLRLGIALHGLAGAFLVRGRFVPWRAIAAAWTAACFALRAISAAWTAA
jgi:hypothetical protein